MRRARIIVFPALVAAGCVLVVATAIVANLPVFDERLLAELETLKEARAPILDQNAYPMALGFLAAGDIDPGTAGEALLKSLHERHEAGERIAVDPQELRMLLGATGQAEDWRSRFKSLECVARVELDCADQLIAEVAKADLSDPRLAILFRRFEALTHQQRFDEGQERDIYTPFAPYAPIRSISRILLAESFGRDSPAEFIAEVAIHHRFWRLMLRDGETLGVKMIALAGIQDTLDFLSALMRERDLTGAEVRSVLASLAPLTARESDISDAFVSEARIQVLTDELPLARDASLLDRSMLQENATLNEFYLRWILPMRLRAKLSASEFHLQGANRTLDYSRRRFPPSIFNRGGTRLVGDMQWDPEQFVARTHDQNGRILLVLLQAEVEQSPGTAISGVLESSSHRNPYTGEPMQYNSRSQTIGFQCLHTAFHPPALPDNCAVAIGDRR